MHQPTGVSSNTLETLARVRKQRHLASQAVRDKFERWAKPLSDTENKKCQKAEIAIKSALKVDADLLRWNPGIYTQGSYKADTNVRHDSDVDIRVQYSNVFVASYPTGVTKESLGLVTANFDFYAYRSKIRQALHNKFTSCAVNDGDKVFNVKENTCRINADVLPTIGYHEYFYVGYDLMYRCGVCFWTKSREFIINWPEQTYANGVAKNKQTQERYKRVVRVLKGLRNEMEEKGYESAKKISSHQIACLAYNVSNSRYGATKLYGAVRDVSFEILNHVRKPVNFELWTEIDEIKQLFPPEQSNKMKEVKAFFSDLWAYAELWR